MKDTLNLPKTSFPMKANLAQREPEILQRWERDDIYGQIREARAQSRIFVLHDGPPYANGHIHHGHVLNKILKDLVVKSKTMAGFNTAYLPGWDCHGLPIEHAVDKTLGDRKKDMSTAQIVNECRKFAQNFIDIQRAEFRRLGVLGEWDEPYYTMRFSYEAEIARQFAAFVRGGYVYKGLKPVHWDPVSRTALAEAEVEYHDHVSPSVYVAFPFDGDPAQIDPALAGKDVEVIIWTTTPWTLPANMAIAFHPDFDYVAYEHEGKVYIFAEGLAFAVQSACGFEGGTDKILARFKGALLEGMKARHPWIDRESVFVMADYVTLEAGTGCVHTAPGHGADDYFTGVDYGIPVYSPVDDGGCFTPDVEHWAGVNVFKANPLIVEFMRENGCLLHAEEFSHSYPFGWRSKSPVIFRATEQWFFSVDHAGLRDRALQAIAETEWIPAWGEERMALMLKNRPDWCISRQRVWGVPIVAFHCQDCGEAILEAELIERAADKFEESGAASWFELPKEEFLPAGFACPKCGSKKLLKETDTLDVWFDSGVSHAAVLGKRDDLPWPSDLYLEGQDQYRGWFQSSLLCGLAAKGGKPFHQVLTHGFVVDATGKAMSKSLGNVIDIQGYVDRNGAEILRLWVAMTDYRDDIRVSDEILKRNAEAYRKFRNTCRFMLGNLYDFDPETDAVPVAEMEEIDRYAMAIYERLRAKIVRAYERYEFHTVYHALNSFVTVDLSAFYLDIHKDRLYCEAPDSHLRRSAQSAIFAILDGIVRLAAPIISFTTDEIWEQMPAWNGKEPSVHLVPFPGEVTGAGDGDLLERWERLRDLREAVLKALEEARDAKTIGQSLEAKVVLTVPAAMQELVERYSADLVQLFIVSAVDVEVGDKLDVAIEKAPGEKCERCWVWSPHVGRNVKHPTVCERCAGVLESIGAESGE